MSEDFRKFADDLQETIIREASTYYAGKVVDLWLDPRNFAVLDKPHGYAKVTGPCGDTMEIFLRIERNIVEKATFATDGCAPSIAAGEMATELAIGKTLDEARAITDETILEALGGLPDESKHCALLAANVLAKAIAEYLQKKGTRNADTNPAHSTISNELVPPKQPPGL